MNARLDPPVSQNLANLLASCALRKDDHREVVRRLVFAGVLERESESCPFGQ
jgi:hypothetical protein